MATPETNPHSIVDRTEEAPGVEAAQTRRERFRVLSSRHRPRRGRTWLIFAVVLVGRGSQHFLRHRDDALRVFLYAPRQVKIDRLIAEGLNEEDAAESVNTVDSERAAFIEKYFHMKWPNPSLYHAMLNTVIGVDGVIDSIISLKRTMEQRTRAIA